VEDAILGFSVISGGRAGSENLTQFRGIAGMHWSMSSLAFGFSENERSVISKCVEEVHQAIAREV